jgi:hypothetical protein
LSISIPTDINTDIDRQLRMLAADIADMQTLLQTWEGSSESERLTWETEWPAVAALLATLCRHDRNGSLTDDQRSMAPLLRNYGFVIPGYG